MSLTAGSLFAGIGGFDLALQRYGVRTVWAAEKDQQCNSVRRRYFPDEETVNDVALVSGRRFKVDILCGGFPCQDLSVAGKRAGLAGKRSGLWWEFARIIEEQAPRWVLIENVPGLLSSNGGRDFGTVLGTLVQLGYGFAYRILDAQWWGVPQRRRRVFIVGYFGDWRGAAEVLFEPESLPWDSPPSREGGEDVAGTLSASAGRGGLGGVGCSKSSITSRIVAFQPKASITQPMNPSEICPTIGCTKQPAIAYQCQGANVGPKGTSVRLIMPIEAERLMGFPECWTRYGEHGEEISDNARYRMLGNSLAVPVVEWILRRLVARDELDRRENG